jgi:hypothetical protein
VIGLVCEEVAGDERVLAGGRLGDAEHHGQVQRVGPGTQRLVEHAVAADALDADAVTLQVPVEVAPADRLPRCPAASRAARVKTVMTSLRVKYVGHGATIHSWLPARVAAAITEPPTPAGIEYSSIMISMGVPLPFWEGRGSQKREPTWSGSLRLSATYSERSCRWEAPRSTPSDVDRPIESAWHARGLGFESP